MSVATIEYQKDGATTTLKTLTNVRPSRFCELFFLKAKGDQLEVHIYSTVGMNNMAATHDSCPEAKVSKLNLADLKAQYALDALYFNKPRFYVFDAIDVPVGAQRNFNGLDFSWVASSHLPKGFKMEPGFLTYKRSPVERKTTITFQTGRPVFLIDDADGKVWVMKAFRDDYGQTYDNLTQLGSRYKNLPSGWKFRVETLAKDLVLRPTAGVATITQDEFENTYDYLGDGSSNFVP